MSFTIAGLVEFEEEIKKSRFQGFAVPVQSEQDVKDFLELKKDITTTHQCWAWKIGNNVRFNDDGEPSGTAGRPILATIEGSNDLTNVLVLVNRWYGGIKLGTGGLVRAYGGCASKTLMLAEKIELIPKQSAELKCNFGEWAKLQYQLNQDQIEYIENYTADGVIITCEIQAHQIEQLRVFLQDLTRGREQLKLIEDDAND